MPYTFRPPPRPRQRALQPPLAQAISSSLGATLGAAPAFVRGRLLGAALALRPAFRGMRAKLLAATVAASALLARGAHHRSSAALAAAPVLRRRLGRALGAASTLVGHLARRARKVLFPSIAALGSLRRVPTYTAPARVNSDQLSGHLTSPATGTLSFTPAASNVLVCCVTSMSTSGLGGLSTVSSIAQTGATWTKIAASSHTASSFTVTGEIWVATGATGSTLTFTFSNASNTTNWAANVSEWRALSAHADASATFGGTILIGDTSSAPALVLPGADVEFGLVAIQGNVNPLSGSFSGGPDTQQALGAVNSAGTLTSYDVTAWPTYQQVASGPTSETAAWVWGDGDGSHPFAGVVVGLRAVHRSMLLSALETLGGGLLRARGKALAAALAAGALLGRRPLRHLAAALGPAPALVRRSGHRLSALLVAAPLVAAHQALARRLGATLGTTAALARRPARALGAALLPAATLLRQTRPVLDAALAALGALGVLRARLYGLAASLAAAPTLGRAPARAFAAACRAQGAFLRARGYLLSAQLASAARLGRRTQHRVAASLGAAATIARSKAARFAAGLRALPSVHRRAARAHRALLAPAAGLRASAARLFAAALSLAGALGDVIHPFAPALREALRAVARAAQFLTTERTAALAGAARRAVFTSLSRPLALVADWRDSTLLAIPVRAGDAPPYISPGETNVAFTIDLTDALGTQTLNSATLVAATYKYASQGEDDRVALANSFVNEIVVLSDQVTLVCGDASQVLGTDVEVQIALHLGSTPASVWSLYVPLPVRKGAPV